MDNSRTNSNVKRDSINDHTGVGIKNKQRLKKKTVDKNPRIFSSAVQLCSSVLYGNEFCDTSDFLSKNIEMCNTDTYNVECDDVQVPIAKNMCKISSGEGCRDPGKDKDTVTQIAPGEELNRNANQVRELMGGEGKAPKNKY